MFLEKRVGKRKRLSGKVEAVAKAQGTEQKGTRGTWGAQVFFTKQLRLIPNNTGCVCSSPAGMGLKGKGVLLAPLAKYKSIFPNEILLLEDDNFLVNTNNNRIGLRPKEV